MEFHTGLLVKRTEIEKEAFAGLHDIVLGRLDRKDEADRSTSTEKLGGHNICWRAFLSSCLHSSNLGNYLLWLCTGSSGIVDAAP